MLKQICFLLLTFCVLFTAEVLIINILTKSTLKKFDKLMYDREYDNALKLLESSKKFGIQRYFKDQLLYLYFTTNQYDKFKYSKRNYGYIKPTSDLVKQKAEIEYKIINIIFLYLKDEINQANNEFIEVYEKYNNLEFSICSFGLYNLFSVSIIMNAYHAENYIKLKDLYNCLIQSTINTSIITIITYYMCRVYELENNTEAILKLIDENKIGSNHYSHYLDKWRINK